MTNVKRPSQLHFQRPSITMVSSSSGPGPFGDSAGDSSEGSTSSMPGQNSANSLQTPHSQPLPPTSLQQPQPALRSTPIRPNALINFNCLAQTPTVSSNNLISPMQAHMMMFSRSATQNQRPTCWSSTLNGPESTTTTTTTTTSGNNSNYTHQSKALSPSGLNDSQPSQIMPHLFVGNQEQTNRETINKLNIKYILSLGLLPMIMNNANANVTSLSPVSPATINKKAATIHTKDNHNQHNHHHHHHQPQNLMPMQNCSRDFKIRIRSNTPTTPTSPIPANSNTNGPQQSLVASSSAGQNKTSLANSGAILTKPRDENKGVKQVRSVYCKCINISDNSDQSLSEFFDEAFSFIEEARRKKCNILIHCLAGISRSPTIAIAYLMRVRSLHWKDAYDLVKQCRPQIDPNLNFMGQLRIYNKSLRDENTAIANKTKCCIEHNKSSCCGRTTTPSSRDLDNILELP